MEDLRHDVSEIMLGGKGILHSTAGIPPLTGSLVAIDRQCHIVGSLLVATGEPDPEPRYPACGTG
ncbi:MAG: hypothetical protein ACM3OO_08525 [Planctomycetaceae bacterium]